MGRFLEWEIVDKDNHSQYVGTVSVPFCAMRYIKDGRYFLADEARELKCVRNARQNNADLYQRRSPDVTADFHSPRILAIPV